MLKAYCQDFWRYRFLLQNLIGRDFKLKYRRSVLGVVWSVLNPLLMNIVMVAVFSSILDMRGSGIDNFPVYLLIGQLLFNFFGEATSSCMSSMLGAAPLIKKVYIPKFIFPVSRVLSSFVTMSFSLVAILIVMLVTRTPFRLPILLFPIPMVLLLVFCIGIGMVLSALAVYFRDIMHLYSVITMAWMYATPIFYPLDPEVLPQQLINLIKLNPMYHYINFFRQIVLYGSVPGINTWFACAASALVSLLIGLAIFRKMQKNFILYL